MTKDKPASVPLEDIYHTITDTPGINRTELAKKLDIPRGSLEGRLASLENRKLYISEDRYGRLYAHDDL